MSPDAHSTDAVLSVRDLSVSFATRQGVVRAVDGLSFDVGAETLAVTTLGGWRQGRRVNLERSLRVGDELQPFGQSRI